MRKQRTGTPVIKTVIFNKEPEEQEIIAEAEKIKQNFRKAYLFIDSTDELQLRHKRYIPNRNLIFIKAY